MSARLRIAIADHDFEMRNLLRRVLPQHGHTVVVSAENGAQLMEGCRVTVADLIITEVRMPVMDGLQAIRKICCDRAMPVILVTASNDSEFVRHACEQHVFAYLVKPIKMADLEPAITVSMRRFTEFQTLRSALTQRV